METTCDLTKKEFSKFIISQMENTMNEINKTKNIKEKIIASNWNEIYSKIYNFLLISQNYDEESLEKIRLYIHLTSSILDKMKDHGENYDENDLNGFLFEYFYGIIDTIIEYKEWGFKNEK